MSRGEALIALLLLAARPAAAADAEPLHPFRFVEAKRVDTLEGLPPKLQAVFEVFCNEKVVKVIRHEETDPKSGKATIAVGGLAEEDPRGACAGVVKEVTKPAGHAFSGREYSVTRIRR